MAVMNIEGTRRVMETTSHETANQYLRFGWSLINQYVVEATSDQPAAVTYVLASVRRLEDTRQLVTLTDGQAVNEYLTLGWKLIDKYVTCDVTAERRDETIHFAAGLAKRGSAAVAGLGAPGETRIQHGRAARR